MNELLDEIVAIARAGQAEDGQRERHPGETPGGPPGLARLGRGAHRRSL
jgi:hypothetical protein